MPPIGPTGQTTTGTANTGPAGNGPQGNGLQRRNSAPGDISTQRVHGGGPNPNGIFAAAGNGMGPPPLPPRPPSLQHSGHVPGASVLRANAGDYDPDDPTNLGGSVTGDDFVDQDKKARKRSSSLDMTSMALAQAQGNFDKVVMSTVAQSNMHAEVMAEVSASSQRSAMSTTKAYISILRS